MPVVSGVPGAMPVCGAGRNFRYPCVGDSKDKLKHECCVIIR
jgi:hypothetical protein